MSFMQTHQDGGPPWHCDLERMKELFPTEQWQWPGEGGLKVAPTRGAGLLAERDNRRGRMGAENARGCVFPARAQGEFCAFCLPRG